MSLGHRFLLPFAHHLVPLGGAVVVEAFAGYTFFHPTPWIPAQSRSCVWESSTSSRRWLAARVTKRPGREGRAGLAVAELPRSGPKRILLCAKKGHLHSRLKAPDASLFGAHKAELLRRKLGPLGRHSTMWRMRKSGGGRGRSLRSTTTRRSRGRGGGDPFFWSGP